MNSIYLVFSSLEIQRSLIQSKLYYKLFHSVCEETSHKPFKVAAVKKSLSSAYMYIVDKTCFGEFVLSRMITGRHYFLYKYIVTQWFGATAMSRRPLKQVF